MADPNLELEESARLLAQLNEELRTLGYVTDQTARALSVGSTKRAKELETAGEKAVDALFELAGSVKSAASAMNQGAKGASAFNESIDQAATGILSLVTVLGLLVPIGRVLKPLNGALSALGVNVAKAATGAAAMTAGIAGATLAVKGFTDLMKAANEQADKLYKGYSDLARSGAAASDGMKGVFEDAKKFGIAVTEIDGMVSVITQNATELTLFGGGVVRGRQQLASMGKALEGSREYFLRLGYDMTEVTGVMADYIKQQRVAGDFTVRTAADIDRLGQGARRYLEEQDALTKLTGMARQEQEKAREQVRSQERFAAQLESLRQQGRFKEAKALEDTFLILQSQNREAAQGFADIQTGNIQTEAAQKSLMGTQGESMRVAQQIIAGQMNAAEGAQRIARAHGETARSLGTTMGMIGTYNQTYGDLAGDLKLAGLAEQDIVKILERIEADRKKLADTEGREADKMLTDQAKLRATQIRANEAIERFVSANGLPAATAAAQAFASAVANGTESLNKLFGVTGTAPKSTQEAAAQGRVADLEKQVQDMRAKSQANIIGRTTGIGLTAKERKLEQTLQAAEQELAGVKQAQAMYESGLRKAIGDAQAEANTKAYGVVGKLFKKDVELSLEQKRRIEDDFRKQWQSYSQSMRVPGAGAGGYVAPADVLPAPAPMFGGAGGAPAAGAGYFDMVAQLESSGRNIPESGGKSSAHGVYQITKGTFESLAKMTGSPLAGRTFEDMQKDVDLQRQAMELLTDSNVRQLAAANVSTTDAAKYLAHFLGAGGAIRVLKASDNTPIDQAVGADAIASNPNVFKNVATVGDLKNWVRDKTRNEFADGGIATGPTSGYPATLHGTEAVVPLPDGKTIPVRLENDPRADALTEALKAFAQLKSISSLMEVRSTDAHTVISPDLAADQAMATIMNRIWPEIQKGFNSGKLTIDQFRGMFGPVDPEEQARIAAEAVKNAPTFAKGGITKGPSVAGESGPEAVVPLPDGKAIPVTINLKDAASMGTGAFGENEYTGVNLGPITTDLEALKQIAGQLGAYDAATETITDPATWKEILNTGMLMNYDIAGAKIGTKMFGPDIGLEIGTAVKEVMATGDTDVATALKEVKDQFREAMTMVVDAMKDKDYETQQQMLETLQNIAREQGRTADASQRMAQVATN